MLAAGAALLVGAHVADVSAKPAVSKTVPSTFRPSANKGGARNKSSHSALLDAKMGKIVPLSAAQRLNTARRLGILRPNEGVRGTVTLSPRRPWLNPHTVMRANFPITVRPGSGPDGIMRIDGGAGTSAAVILAFRAAANSSYLIDCATSGSGAFDWYNAWGDGSEWTRGSVGVSNGHVTFAIQEGTTRRDLTVFVSHRTAFAVGRCEITEVR